MDTPIPSSSSRDTVPFSLHPIYATYGWVHPPLAAVVDESRVLLTFNALGLIGALDSTLTGLGASREFVVLTTAGGAALELLPDGPLVTGPSLVETAAALAEATGCAVDLGAVSVGQDSPDGTDSYGAPPSPRPFPFRTPRDVLVGRFDPQRMSTLARNIGSPVEVAYGSAETDGLPEGWAIVRPVERTAELHRHHFASSETPVVAMTTIGGQRHVSVLAEAGYLPGAMLTRLAPWSTLTTRKDVAHLDGEDAAAMTDALHWFAHPALAPFSDLLDLQHERWRPSMPHFEIDHTVRALESPDDSQWSGRVLAALKIPTLAARIHEGLTALPFPERIEPARTLTVIADVFRWVPLRRWRRGRSNRYTAE